MRNIGALDHVVIAVRDLDDGEARMARIGFRPTPRGYHSAHMGTANATIVLPDGRTYFEVLGIVAPTAENAARRAWLDERQGLYGIAFKSDDAAAAARAFADLGMGPAEPVAFARPVELPAGMTEAAFTTARTDAEAMPGAWVFVCQHHTPAAVWRQDYLDQPNGAQAILEVLGVADDLDEIERAWSRPFAGLIARMPDRVVFETGTARISFLTPAALAARLGETVRGLSGKAPMLAGLVFQVADLAAAKAFLDGNGVAHESVEGAIRIDPAEACGVVVELRA